MANEIKVGVSLACSNRNFKQPKLGSQIVSIAQAGIGGGAPGIVNIGPADEAIDLTEIAVPGWLWMQNIDQTQVVIWGPDSGGAMVPMGRMRPGEPAGFRLDPGATLRMQVDPATEESGSTSAENQAKVQIVVLED